MAHSFAHDPLTAAWQQVEEGRQGPLVGVQLWQRSLRESLRSRISGGCGRGSGFASHAMTARLVIEAGPRFADTGVMGSLSGVLPWRLLRSPRMAAAGVVVEVQPDGALLLGDRLAAAGEAAASS